MFLLLDKPKGVSSFRFINRYAKEQGIKKIGHTGTLDPLASGLLLVATDDDTKLINYIDKGKKTYVAKVKLFQKSDTYDVTGQITQLESLKISEELLLKTLNSFQGKQMQLPPVFSAKKVNGQRAYELARVNKEVKLKEVEVNILNIKLISFNKQDEFEFECTVSRGTYIRSLIHDLGLKLQTGALMLELRRTMVANLSEANINQEINEQSLITLKTQTISQTELTLFIQGKSVINNYKIIGEYAIAYKSKVMGICKFMEQEIKSIKLFGNKIDKILT